MRPLARTPIRPNHLTALTAALALAGAALLATGDPTLMNWGAGVFVLARFLDHFDGELARLTDRTSRAGYYLDYAAGAASYAALFVGIGVGLGSGSLGGWPVLLGAVGAAAALAAMPLNLGIDAADESDAAVGYPALAGVELEDGIYLLAPITWLGYLQPFFVLACLGAAVYVTWTAGCYLRARASSRRGGPA